MNLRIVSLMMETSCRVLWRNSSNFRLSLLSSVLVLMSIAIIYSIMNGDYSIFSTSDPYEDLMFQIVCQRGSESNANDFLRICRPSQQTYSSATYYDHERPSPSELLFDILSPVRQANMTWGRKSGILETVTNLMMNGLPLVGMDDYILLADIANEYLDAHGGSDKLLAIPELNYVFDNFLNVRRKKLVVITDDDCYRDFSQFIDRSTTLFAGLNVTRVRDIEEMLQNCCENVWAVLELSPSITITDDISKNKSDMRICQMKPVISLNVTMQLEWGDLGVDSYQQTIATHDLLVPAVTIRMHPLSVPDTRNIAWSPIKRSTPRQLSGQLLYFTSGFLSLQFEIQRYLLWKQYGRVSDTSHFVNNSFQGGLNETIINQFNFFRDLTKLIEVSSSGNGDGIDADLTVAMLRNFSFVHGSANERPIQFDMYHRAFPTHSYKKVSFTFCHFHTT